MKSNVHRVVALLAPLLLVATAAAQERAPLRVLFIGNSYTFGNDLPSLVQKLGTVARPKLSIEVERHTPGGCTFERHWKEGAALKKIRAKKWDFVVLQEQSQMPLLDRERMHTYAEKLHGAIAKQGAQTVFFMTWARQHKPETIQGLSEAYLSIAKKLGARVAPVGLAWAEALRRNPKRVLHAPDRSHPNPRGSYLAACVIYAVLSGKSPVGLASIGIPDLQKKERRALQQVAWREARKNAVRKSR